MNIENQNNTYYYLIFNVGKTLYAVSTEYVGYIISASEQFQCCALPGMPYYVNTVMDMGEKMVPIIDLNNFKEHKDLEVCETQIQRRLILILNYCNVPIGLLTDRISLSSEQREVRTETDPIGQNIVVKIGGKNFVLFNVPEFYHQLQM